jgi:hypothetical protein
MRPLFHKNFVKRLERNVRGMVYKLLHHHHKKRLVAGVFGVWILVTLLVSIGLINQSSGTSSANYPAELITALKINDNQELVVDNNINFTITLQNSSPNEGIAEISMILLSTANSMEWNSLKNNEDGEVFAIDPSYTKIDYLGAGERATYNLTGKILDKKIESISTMAKFNYRTKDGLKKTDTNREFLPLTERVNPDISQYLSLGSDAQNYSQGQSPVISVSKNGVLNKNIQGKIFVTDRLEKDIVANENCSLVDKDKCDAIIANLKTGSYSAMFFDEKNNIYSQIVQFEIVGNSTAFTPAENSRLDLPFGPISINGTAYIYVKKVVNENKKVLGNETCEFVISKNGTVVTTIPVVIGSNRDCILRLNSSQVPNEGLYQIALKGTQKITTMSITNKTAGLIELKNNTLVLSQDKPVKLSLEKIINKNNEPISNTKAILYLLHNATGEAQEIKTLNSSLLSVEQGNLNIELPANYIKNGGLYSAFIKLEDGQQSDTISLNFSDKSIGLTNSGILIKNYDKLRIGEPIEVMVAGIKDRGGNIISSGDCGLEVFTRQDSVEPIFVSGVISDGNCNAVISGNLITSSGPVLISATGGAIKNDIEQSRQVYVQSGAPTNFGLLNLEYEPARVGYTNKLIIGPVTDIFGNTTNANDLTLAFIKDDKVVHQEEDLSVIDGFYEGIIPSSVFNGKEGDTLIVSLINQKTGEQLSSKLITLIEDEDRFILPNFPEKINSDENIKIQYSGTGSKDEFACNLQYFRSDIDYTFSSSTYSPINDSCEFDYDLNQYRNNSLALIKLTAKDKIFHKVVANTPGEPANLFNLSPEVRIDSREELQLKFLTSPLVDQQGLAVEKGKVKFEYNGKVVESEIKKGFSSIYSPATMFDKKDIKEIGNDIYLDLDINAKASVISIAKNNNLEVFLNDHDIAQKLDTAELYKGTNIVSSKDFEILQFKTDHCSAIQSSSVIGSQSALTHYQNGICYVQTKSTAGNYILTFERDGFLLSDYDFKVVDYSVAKVEWCTGTPCKISVNGGISSLIEATLYDDEKEYRFSSEEIGNTVTIEENGINPLKEYKVKISFKDSNENTHEIYSTVLGEYLIKKNKK